MIPHCHPAEPTERQEVCQWFTYVLIALCFCPCCDFFISQSYAFAVFSICYILITGTRRPHRPTCRGVTTRSGGGPGRCLFYWACGANTTLGLQQSKYPRVPLLRVAAFREHFGKIYICANSMSQRIQPMFNTRLVSLIRIIAWDRVNVFKPCLGLQISRDNKYRKCFSFLSSSNMDVSPQLSDVWFMTLSPCDPGESLLFSLGNGRQRGDKIDPRP